MGLGVKHLGPAAAEALAGAFGTLDAIQGASEADLASVEGVGPVIAASIRAWFDQPANVAMVEKLRAAGVDFGKVVVSRLPQVLAGKAVVVTGTLEHFSREGAEEAIKGARRQEPGQRQRQDVRGRGGGRTGRVEAHARPSRSGCRSSTRPGSRRCSPRASCRGGGGAPWLADLEVPGEAAGLLAALVELPEHGRHGVRAG